MIKIKEINDLGFESAEWGKEPSKLPVIFKQGILKITMPLWLFYLIAKAINELIVSGGISKFFDFSNILFYISLLFILCIPGFIAGLNSYKKQKEKYEAKKTFSQYMTSLN